MPRNGIVLTAPQREFWHLPVPYGLFCGGYGSGKTEVLVARALYDLQRFPGANIAIYEPTYDLHRLIIRPRIEQWLGLSHKPNAWNFQSSAWYYEVQGLGRIYLRSLSNPGRIIGYETALSYIDEIDSLNQKSAEDAWRRIMARNRQQLRNVRNSVLAFGTPEGFKFTYKRWGESLVAGYGFVRAPSTTNPHLPPEYLSDLYRDYPAQLVDAYIGGYWTNLTGATVYRNFDRSENNSDAQIEPKEPLHIGQDFNVGAMASIVHVIRDGYPVAVAEVLKAFDTPRMLQKIEELYSEHPITFYPDASGASRKSVGASRTDISMIRDAGHRIRAEKSNPLIRDRVLSMNAAFRNGLGEIRYRVNVKNCPGYTAGLEQQIYDDNGVPEKSGDPDDPSHRCDAGGYYIHNRFPARRRTFSTTDLGMR